MLRKHFGTWTRKKDRFPKISAFLIVTGFLCLVVIYPKSDLKDHRNNEARNSPSWYAVFSASTPDGETHRSHDYAFYLPLTALAWERIGFKSFVILVGRRCEWDQDPALKLILSKLEDDRKAVVVFVEAAFEHRVMIGQTSRLFAANLDGFQGFLEDNYLVTSDADLWPIRREHYVPRSNHDLVLVHSECCGSFNVSWRGNRNYQMYPIGNIGADASTWRQIMNDGRTLAHDSSSILTYFEEEGFGTSVRKKVLYDAGMWDLDQKMISIRIQEWMERYEKNNQSVYRVSDVGFQRINRANWDGDVIDDLHGYYDAHMPLKPFLPEQWEMIQPLVNLMYGGSNLVDKVDWIQDYVIQFQRAVKSYIHFNEPDYDEKSERI